MAFKKYVEEAKAWSAGHVVAAVAIGGVIGYFLHMLLF